MHFESENELTDRTLHDQCAANVESLRKARKQFFLRLKDVLTKAGRPIKPVFGLTCSSIIKIYK